MCEGRAFLVYFGDVVKRSAEKLLAIVALEFMGFGF
jgi:hypothetical protein